MALNKLNMDNIYTIAVLYKQDNTSSNTNPTVINNANNSKINFSLAGTHQVANGKMSAKLTKQLQEEWEDVFNGTGCFDGTF